MGTRRMFTREFKLEAVKLVSERGVRVAQAARDLGIGENVLGRGVMKAEDAELAQLRRDLARTKAERDILKKAIAFFAKDPP